MLLSTEEESENLTPFKSCFNGCYLLLVIMNSIFIQMVLFYTYACQNQLGDTIYMISVCVYIRIGIIRSSTYISSCNIDTAMH